MDQDLVSAFKKLEREVKRKQEQERAQKEFAEKELLRLMALNRKRRQERITFAITLTFLSCIGYLAWTSRDTLITSVERTVYELSNLASGGDNSKLDCSDFKNLTKPYCVNRRQEENESNWSGISRYEDGKDKPFAVHKATN